MDFRTKEGHVADFLREGIISGMFPRGSRLKQVEIAKRLQLSVTPVREALKLLEAEGYVTSDSHRGTSVVPFDPSASRETLELSVLLETRLIHGAAEKATTQDVIQLQTLAAEFKKTLIGGDRTAARAIHYRFHRRLYSIAELPQTLHFVQVLWARYPFDFISATEGGSQEAAERQDEILRALLNGDSSAAMLALRKHIETVWSLLQKSA